MDKMSNESKRKWLVCSHVWTKELINKYGGSYHAQLSLCMRELIQQKKRNEHSLF